MSLGKVWASTDKNAFILLWRIGDGVKARLYTKVMESFIMSIIEGTCFITAILMQAKLFCSQNVNWSAWCIVKNRTVQYASPTMANKSV